MEWSWSLRRVLIIIEAGAGGAGGGAAEGASGAAGGVTGGARWATWKGMAIMVWQGQIVDEREGQQNLYGQRNIYGSGKRQ